MASGVLPKQMLREMIHLDHIRDVGEEYLNPASIDLPLSEEAYRLEHTFLPQPGAKIRDHIKFAGGTRYDLKNHLDVGTSYAIRIDGGWRLPHGVYAYANPKSTSGRCGLSTKLVADKVDMYDHLSDGWGQQGESMWVIVCPGAFPVQVAPRLALSQIRLFKGASFLDELSADFEIERHGLLFDQNKNRLSSKEVRRHRDSFFLSVKVGKAMGWECRGSQHILDMTKPAGSYDPSRYFTPINPGHERFVLRARTFYILATHERVMVPPNLSAELREVDPRFFDGSIHNAGFIDPGWGWGKEGEGYGRPITLEVWPIRDTLIQNKQRIGRIRYEHMLAPPDVSYDEGNANYAAEDGVKLAKYFK